MERVIKTSNVMINLIDSHLNYLDTSTSKKTLYIYILFTLCLISFPIVWTGNEENYFQLANKRITPDQFGFFHSVFDASNGRIVFETLLGYLISLSGYESAHTIARILNILILTAGLTVFFSSAGFTVLTSVSSVIVFHLFGQQFIGGEWIFGGVEAKTFAYAAIFASLGYAFKEKWFSAILLAILATYFHFLVGGFWAAIIIILGGLSTRKTTFGLKLFIGYSITVLPIVITLATDQFAADLSNAARNVTDIYVNRSSHHITPFYSLFQFKAWFPGIIFLTCFGMFLFLIRSIEPNKRIIDLSLFLVGYLFLALIVSFFDQDSHLFSKFYLFRPSSLILLLCITATLQFYRNQASKIDLNIFRFSIFPIVIFFIAVESPGIVKNYFFDSSPSSEDEEIIHAVNQFTNPEDIVLIDNAVVGFGGNSIRLHRKFENPTLVAWKFVPTHPTDLIEWDRRITFSKELFKNGCTDTLDYPVKFLLTFSSESLTATKNCGPVIWSNDKNISLIRVLSK